MPRRLIALMTPLLLLLAGCGGESGREDSLALSIRGKWLAMEGCAGSAEITADYGERVYTYGVDFAWSSNGACTLTLTAPEELAGMTARAEAGSTALEYDGVRVETGPLNDDGLSPMDALPALVRAVREGYLAECAVEALDGEEVLRATVRDPERPAGSGAQTDVWLTPDGVPLRGEIAQDGFTVIRCEFSSFTMECGEE